MGQVPISGQHTHTYPNGDVYTGFYHESQRNGHGVIVFHTGSKYTGDWLYDRRHGYGEMTYARPSGEVIQQPIPSFIPDDPNSFRYRALKRFQQFRQSQQSRDDLHSNVHIGTYRGYWLSDKRNAFGVFTYSNNDMYFGEWVNDCRQGKGYLLLANNDEYEGIYKENILEGWGVVRLDCFEPDLMRKSLKIRIDTMKERVEAHLARQQLLPQHQGSYNRSNDGPASTIQSLDAFLADTIQNNASSKGSGPSREGSEISPQDVKSDQPTLESQTTAEPQAVRYPGSSIRPPQETDITPTSLLTYAIAREEEKMKFNHELNILPFQLSRDDPSRIIPFAHRIPFVTHRVEVEGVFRSNQLEQYSIIRVYVPIPNQNSGANDEETQRLLDITIDPLLVETHAVMIVTSLNQQYRCEIRIADALVGRRVIETDGKLDIDEIELQIAEEGFIENDINQVSSPSSADVVLPSPSIAQTVSPAVRVDAPVVVSPVSEQLREQVPNTQQNEQQQQQQQPPSEQQKTAQDDGSSSVDLLSDLDALLALPSDDSQSASNPTTTPTTPQGSSPKTQSSGVDTIPAEPTTISSQQPSQPEVPPVITAASSTPKKVLKGGKRNKKNKSTTETLATPAESTPAQPTAKEESPVLDVDIDVDLDDLDALLLAPSPSPKTTRLSSNPSADSIALTDDAQKAIALVDQSGIEDGDYLGNAGLFSIDDE